MKKNHPDFVVIGAMKSASTSLANLLGKHPEIYISTNKEPGFFSRDERYARGIEQYLSLYSEARDNQITGEAHIYYSRKGAHNLKLTGHCIITCLFWGKILKIGRLS